MTDFNDWIEAVAERASKASDYFEEILRRNLYRDTSKGNFVCPVCSIGLDRDLFRWENESEKERVREELKMHIKEHLNGFADSQIREFEEDITAIERTWELIRKLDGGG